MSQLIIAFSDTGWRHVYHNDRYTPFKTLKPPRSSTGKEIILGRTVDNREAWRKKIDQLTSEAEYEIVLKQPKLAGRAYE